MADDLKISEMVELLSGDLHDDIQFEVIDQTEAELVDQNKRVKLVTLEAAFGAEDKIFEGDSSIEIIDTGTGQIDTTIDAQLLSRYTLAQLYFQVEDAVNGVAPYIDLDGAGSALKLGYQLATWLEIQIGSDPHIRARSGTDTWLDIHPDTQILGSTAAGNSNIYINQTGNIIQFNISATEEMRLSTAGMELKTGPAVNEIETVLTNDDTHLPTSGAVFDAIAAIETDKISEGDSYVEVVDTGTGYIVMVVDGVEVARWTAASAEMHLGVNDTRQGILHIYGSNISTEGGKLRLYYGGSGGTGAPEYGDIYYSATNGIEIGLPGVVCAAFGAQSDAKLYYQNNPRFRTNNIGAQVERGSALMYFYNTGSDLHWEIKNQGNGGQIIMAGKQPGGAEVDIATFDYNGLDLATGMGLSFNGGQAINTIETVLTNDDTHLPTSGAVYDAIAAISISTVSGDPIILNNPTWGTNLQIQGSSGDFKFVNMTADYAIAIEGYDGVTKRTCATFDAHAGNFWYHIGAQVMKTVAAGLEVNDTLQSYTNLYLKVDNNGTAGGQDTAIACIANGAVELYYNAIKEAETASGALKAVNGFQIAASGIVTDIETAITDDDTKLPTSGAVIDLIHSVDLVLGAAAGEYVEIDGTGNEVKVGIAGGDKAVVTADGLELKGDQTGAAAIGNAATSVSVTFGTAHADANYQVLCTMENTTDGSPLFLIPVVTAKATTGFTVTLSAATDSANYVLNWMVLRA